LVFRRVTLFLFNEQLVGAFWHLGNRGGTFARTVSYRWRILGLRLDRCFLKAELEVSAGPEVFIPLGTTKDTVLEGALLWDRFLFKRLFFNSIPRAASI